jgi:hypothetical protein
MPITFVVSTGRAGSTLLSRMLALHPQVLSISEFFAVLMGILRRNPYPAAPMDGAELWRIASAPDPLADAMVRCGQHVPEMFYPYASGRFTASSGIPIISHSTLSLLSDDPDGLYDQLAGQVPSWPVRPAAEQYRALFALLARLLGRPVVVERSGGSLTLVSLLRREFPEARFLFMHRDGPDTALSMSRFPMFKLGVMATEAAQEAGLPVNASMDEITARLPERYLGILSPPYDLCSLPSVQISPVWFGELWSTMICSGTTMLAQVPEQDRSEISYSDLLSDTEGTLTRLAGFLGVAASGQWCEAAAGLCDRSRPGAASKLEPDLHARLEAACQPGREALAAFLGTTSHDGSATLR